MFNNQDRPGIVGYVGTLLSKHNVNIANLSLSRDHAGGHALSVFHVDSEPPTELLDELRRDAVFSNVRVVKL